MSGSIVTTPPTWSLDRPESRVATMILGVIAGGSGDDRADLVLEVYREYARSDAAQAAETGPYSLEVAVVSVLMDLARHDRVTDETREPLLWIAGLGTRS